MIEFIKWLIPLVLSLIAVWRSFRDGQRTRSDNSSRSRQQYNTELRRWANDCILTFSEAAVSLKEKELNVTNLSKLASKLFAQADQGRLLFPNPAPDSQLQDGVPSAASFRPRILDWLVFGSRLCSAISSGEDLEALSGIMMLSKGFTLDAQMALDPINLSTTLEDLTELLKHGAFMETRQDHVSLLRVGELIRVRTSVELANQANAE